MRPDLAELITKEEALGRLFEVWNPTQEIEVIPVTEAAGRILAGDQYAGYNLPVVRASAMDGIAVRSGDFEEGMPDTAHWKQGVDYVRADTGDDFPDEYDTVIAVEDVTFLENGGITLSSSVNIRAGLNVKPGGSDVRKGTLLAPAGRQLSAPDLSAIAMGGICEIPVIRKPKVAFLPTGSELIAVGEPLERGQNFDTNSVLVSQMLTDMGAEPILHSIVKDDREALREALDSLLSQADIVLVNAGTSKGGEDYCAGILEEKGTVLFHGVSAVPGRPISMAMVGEKPVVNLAGPSFAAFYNMDWAVRAMICHYLGIPVPTRMKVKAVLQESLQVPPFFSIMAAFDLEKDTDGTYLATPLVLRGPHSAGSAAALAADGIYISQLGEKSHAAGEEIEVELMRNPAQIRTRG